MNSDNKNLIIVIIVCLTLIALTAIVAAVFYSRDYSGNAHLSKPAEGTEEITKNDENDITYRTPWPPTEAQSSCQKRLDAYLAIGGINKQILGGAYCGGTGKIIGVRQVDDTFHKFVISEDQLLKQ